MDLTRRAALRMGGGLGLGSLLAGNSAAKAVPSLIPKGMPREIAVEPVSDSTWGLFRAFENDHIEWRNLGSNDIDPDLRDMRSLSPTIRRIIQRTRNVERRARRTEMRKFLGLK